jgi:hypothetical protein
MRLTVDRHHLHRRELLTFIKLLVPWSARRTTEQ